MPFCPSCGKSVEPKWTFCGACGARIAAELEGRSSEARDELLDKVSSIERIASKVEGDKRNEAVGAVVFFVAAALFLLAMYHHPEWIDTSWAYELSRELHELVE